MLCQCLLNQRKQEIFCVPLLGTTPLDITRLDHVSARNTPDTASSLIHPDVFFFFTSLLHGTSTLRDFSTHCCTTHIFWSGSIGKLSSMTSSWSQPRSRTSIPSLQIINTITWESHPLSIFAVMSDYPPPSYEAASYRRLWPIVSPYVKCEDLLSACLVSREWHRIFAPQLWGNPATRFGADLDAVYCKKSSLLICRED